VSPSRGDSALNLSEFDYTLPPALIAQHPASPRDSARMLVLHRSDGRLNHRVFRDLAHYLTPRDVLVLNDTRVIPARLRGRKASGGAVEVLLLRPVTASGGGARDERWETLVRPGRRVRRGAVLRFGAGLSGTVVESRPDGVRVVAFSSPRGVLAAAREIGAAPLPPYIHAPLRDPEEYQTVYAAADGAVAAPTAGLHFTPALLHEIETWGVAVVVLTLHIGLGTFRRVISEDVTAHRMDAEWYRLTPEAAECVNARRAAGGRVVAVGTSSVRALETAADPAGRLRPGEGWSEVFIYPGYRFLVTDALVTNFHLPKTTLLMLVSALAGRDAIHRAYAEAIRERYRFYSFGDAMLIL
jgi:S-adenosylmethionine:tRNA ribosyltransferase-isomerase